MYKNSNKNEYCKTGRAVGVFPVCYFLEVRVKGYYPLLRCGSKLCEKDIGDGYEIIGAAFDRREERKRFS